MSNKISAVFMYKYTNTILLFISCIVALFVYKPVQEVMNYYNIPNSLVFNNNQHILSWSANPNGNYYKQEYISQGESLKRFNDMVMIDFLITDIPVMDVVQDQIKKIEERKKTDNVCNYKVIKNEKSDEFILDFIISESTGKAVNVVEWDAYRYKYFVDKSGHKGILLFGFSHRAYDSNTTDFLKSFGQYRRDILNKVRVYQMPEIRLK